MPDYSKCALGDQHEDLFIHSNEDVQTIPVEERERVRVAELGEMPGDLKQALLADWVPHTQHAIVVKGDQ